MENPGSENFAIFIERGNLFRLCSYCICRNSKVSNLAKTWRATRHLKFFTTKTFRMENSGSEKFAIFIESDNLCIDCVLIAVAEIITWFKSGPDSACD